MKNKLLSIFSFLCVAAGLLLLILDRNRLWVWLLVLSGVLLGFLPVRQILRHENRRELLSSFLSLARRYIPSPFSGRTRRPGHKDRPAAGGGDYEEYLQQLLSELQRQAVSEEVRKAAAESPKASGDLTEPDVPKPSETVKAAEAEAPEPQDLKGAAAPKETEEEPSRNATEGRAAFCEKDETAQADTGKQKNGEQTKKNETGGRHQTAGPGPAGNSYKRAKAKRFDGDFFKQARFRYSQNSLSGQQAFPPQILFFSGIDNTRDLKKRYHDLLKIYHPDNQAGNGELTLSIQREYEYVLSILEENGR